MKRFLAVMLLLMLLLGVAFAEDTLYQKLLYQVQNGSGLQLELRMESEGKLPAWIAGEDSAASSVINGMLAKIHFQQTSFGTQKGREQLMISLNKGETELAKLNYLTDGALESISSSLLGQNSYVAVKGHGIQNFIFQSGAWPSIEGMLLKMYSKDFAFKGKLQERLIPYANHVRDWLGSKTELKSGGDFSVALTKQDIVFELKQLIEMFYADEALLSLLKEAASVEESAAYLDAGIKPLLFSALEAIQLDDNVRITRSFHKNGKLKQSEIVLPFAAGNTIKNIVLQQDLKEDESGKTGIMLYYADGSKKGVSYEKKGDILEGEIVLGSEKGEQKLPFIVRYSISAPKHDQQTQKISQDIKADMKLSDIHILADLSLHSEASNRKPTFVEGKLQIKQNEGALNIALQAKSTAPWSIPTVDVSNAVRLDHASESEKQLIYQQMKDDFIKGLTALFLGK